MAPLQTVVVAALQQAGNGQAGEAPPRAGTLPLSKCVGETLPHYLYSTDEDNTPLKPEGLGQLQGACRQDSIEGSITPVPELSPPRG